MTDVLSELVTFREAMLEIQREKEREKCVIGFITGTPYADLTDEQIKEYKRQAWLETMRNQFIPIRLKQDNND